GRVRDLHGLDLRLTHGAATVGHAPHTAAGVRQQTHALEVGPGPGQPVFDLRSGAVTVEYRLCGLGQSRPGDHGGIDLLDDTGSAEFDHRLHGRPEKIRVRRQRGLVTSGVPDGVSDRVPALHTFP